MEIAVKMGRNLASSSVKESAEKLTPKSKNKSAGKQHKVAINALTIARTINFSLLKFRDFYNRS